MVFGGVRSGAWLWTGVAADVVVSVFLVFGIGREERRGNVVTPAENGSRGFPARGGLGMV